MRVLIRVDCEVASIRVCGVFEIQLCAVVGREFDGDGVCNNTSNLEITLCGLCGTSPVAAKPPCMFFSVIEAR